MKINVVKIVQKKKIYIYRHNTIIITILILRYFGPYHPVPIAGMMPKSYPTVKPVQPELSSHSWSLCLSISFPDWSQNGNTNFLSYCANCYRCLRPSSYILLCVPASRTGRLHCRAFTLHYIYSPNIDSSSTPLY